MSVPKGHVRKWLQDNPGWWSAIEISEFTDHASGTVSSVLSILVREGLRIRGAGVYARLSDNHWEYSWCHSYPTDVPRLIEDLKPLKDHEWVGDRLVIAPPERRTAPAYRKRGKVGDVEPVEPVGPLSAMILPTVVLGHVGGSLYRDDGGKLWKATQIEEADLWT